MFVKTDGARLYYNEVGSGVPVLALPPFPFDHDIWREQRNLADAARLIMPDLRGTGQSSLTPGPYTMALLADDAFALLDALKIDRAVVMGVSMGGYVALAMYAKDPGRVQGLILADTRAEADDPETVERRQRTVEGLWTQGTIILRKRVDSLFGATTRRARPALVKKMWGEVAQANPEGLAQITLGMAERPDRTALLPEIAVPTLVLCGEEDSASPPDGMRALAARIPGAKFALIPQAGHLSPLEQPGLFNRHVREFLVQFAAKTP